MLPVLLLYDAAWGVSGALRPWTTRPRGRRRGRQADLSGGDLLVLPFSAYRAPAWNHRHTVLDPLGRYLAPNYVADDDLVVDGRTVPGEDPRVPRPAGRSRCPLPRPGPGRCWRWGSGASPPRPTRLGAGRRLSFGRPVLSGPGLVIVRLRGTPHDRTVSSADRAVMAVAWAAYAGSFLVGLVLLGVRGARSGGTGGVLGRLGL